MKILLKNKPFSPKITIPVAWKASFAQGDAQAPAPCPKAAAPFRPRLREPLPNAPPRAPRPALLPRARPKSSQPGTLCLAPARDRRRHMWGRSNFRVLRTCAVLIYGVS